MARTLIACCVTILCRALLGRDRAVVCGVVAPVAVLGDTRLFGSTVCTSVSGTGCTLLIAGTPPGVLFHVILLCTRGVVIRARLRLDCVLA